jgi:hypothetical protein
MGVQKPTAATQQRSSFALRPKERTRSTDPSNHALVESAVNLPFPGDEPPKATRSKRAPAAPAQAPTAPVTAPPRLLGGRRASFQRNRYAK